MKPPYTQEQKHPQIQRHHRAPYDQWSTPLGDASLIAEVVLRESGCIEDIIALRTELDSLTKQATG